MHESDEPTDTPRDEAGERERCRVAALRILNYRWNSEAELRRKLKRKAFADDVIDPILAQLIEEKWLDDARFAAAFTRERARRSIGSRRIIRELGNAGVDAETAQRVAGETVDRDSEREALVALCRKKMRMIARRHGPDYPATDEGRKKLTAHLLNQGYEMGEVLSVIKEETRRSVASE